MRTFLAALFTLVTLAMTPPAFAQQKTGTAPARGEVAVKVALLNLDMIRAKAKVTKNVGEQIKKYHDAIQQDIKKEEDTLRGVEQELNRKRTLLAPEAYAAERRKFEQRLSKVQAEVQQRLQALNKVRLAANEAINKALIEVIKKVSEENHLTLVLNAQQTIFYATALDISDIVLERLDKKLPAFKVAKPDK
ncbi:OmpH family outer membrane protein [Varunaivibrio sulfuroxidans]|uniref:Periplasmic chaperone for outer membrane proteins Skp n=1 Tax=Varunaivibrio sulfuroxidans TaxID=1773489 RepID=A0A4R3JE66_9PROT|nr:OmpH family outer membrane protein [Varunaivibrio sulfuroxidans]TCS64162.1 periplasmic chaperone for outer membrane proteins Skp [Varunaivibrio sulfuroxidans]WES31392.1 OmpH family outer membrane protein [Varunaivibrio sulfuroxidans]